MSKRRKGRKTEPPAAVAPPVLGADRPRRFGEAEVLALLAAALAVVHSWLARSALNPDGVSYLDLAGALAAGDWPSFVQGYWSPLYPALIALTSSVTPRDPVSLVALAHAINGAAAIAAIALLWWWSRQAARLFLARALIATLLLISSGLPRIEAVTPDVVLLALMTWLGYELLVHRGDRAIRTGLLLGAAFLAKTSAAPWLLLTIPLRLWGARDSTQHRRVLLSSVVCVAVMLLWIVPMSLEAGHLTMGSAGRLNYCWYIDACDSRTPDTHQGDHTAYHQMAVDSTRNVVWAEFTNTERWTYAPWSDPTAWDAGVQTRHSSAPYAWDLISYWGRQAFTSFGIWLSPVILGVLLPWYLIGRRPGMGRSLVNEDRPTLVVGLLGLAGVLQFVLVHSEPRLIAPFGMLFALAVLHQVSGHEAVTPRLSMAVRQAATLLGLLAAVGFAVPRLKDGLGASARIPGVLSAMASTNTSLANAGLSQSRLVILGPAIPVSSSAYLTGAHIVAQVAPSSVEILRSLPSERQRELITAMFAGKARVAWVTTPQAGVSILVIPAQ